MFKNKMGHVRNPEEGKKRRAENQTIKQIKL
jgi:hypothetical protein